MPFVVSEIVKQVAGPSFFGPPSRGRCLCRPSAIVARCPKRAFRFLMIYCHTVPILSVPWPSRRTGGLPKDVVPVIIYSSGCAYSHSAPISQYSCLRLISHVLHHHRLLIFTGYQAHHDTHPRPNLARLDDLICYLSPNMGMLVPGNAFYTVRSDAA